MPQQTDLIELFTKNSQAASTTVVQKKNIADAADYACQLCAKTPSLHPSGKTLAAPHIPPTLLKQMTECTQSTNTTPPMELVANGLRKHMKGVDVGFSIADMAIAETATIILRCASEDARLASMLCETHVVALPQSKIVADSYAAENFLRETMTDATYTAFISGCSRTSDIERVLTLGAHGPLALHVVLIEEE